MKRKAVLLPLLIIAGALSLCFESCRIEPPLNLADASHIEFLFPEVETDIHVIWGDEIEGEWWYGWDADDERLFGKIEYPEPRDYEVRHYYLGRSRGDWLQLNSFTVDGHNFRRNLYFGYHDLLFWSNVVTDLGVQALLVDENDPNDIKMTTSPTRISYLPSRAQNNVFNSPEPFFSALYRGLYVSKNPEDYDYSYTDDKGNQIYVKKLDVDVTPMVYTYLVQVVVYNNKGRIRGLTDMASVSSMAKGVSVHTGMTSEEDVIVAWDMRMKKNLPARNGRMADIMGGKLTTFGLCGMQPWRSSRSAAYRGPRGDLRNKVGLSMSFTDYKDSVYYYDVTEQMQRQAHGGIITIEIDADTLTYPHRPTASGSPTGFDPTVIDRDTLEYEFGL